MPGGELEGLIGRDAHQAVFVGPHVAMSVPKSWAIWKRVSSSARRVIAKRAPSFGKAGSGFL